MENDQQTGRLKHSRWMHEDYLIMVERGVPSYKADHLCYCFDCVMYLYRHGFINKVVKDLADNKIRKEMYKAEKEANK